MKEKMAYFTQKMKQGIGQVSVKSKTISAKCKIFFNQNKDKLTTKDFRSRQADVRAQFSRLIKCLHFTKGEQRALGAGALALAVVLTIVVASSPMGNQAVAPKDISINPFEKIKVQKTVYSIQVNGTDILYLATEEEASQVLEGVISRYQTSGAQITSQGFLEPVEVVKNETTKPTVLFSVEDGINYIITGTTQPKLYVVKGGDNLWDIAITNGISQNKLEEINPGVDPERLLIGQELNLYETQPFLTVHFTETVTSQERVAYNTNYEETDSLYKGQTQVKAIGSYGSKEIVSEVVKENGVVVASTVLSETVTQEPVTQVTLKGTKAAPVYTASASASGSGSGSGKLSSPVGRIEVSSAYGSRGGGRHLGVDLRNPKGTPITAAADGVVTFAAYSGSYGNLIKISHGGGLETLYSHCDTMSVSTGDTVSRGQVIATVGISGNATGYHLHFEVRLNGVAQNPMNYI